MPRKTEPKNIHLVGIKGVAMTGLALMLKRLSYQVTGSDTAEVFSSDEVLKSAEIPVFQFSADLVTKLKPDLIVASAAYGLTNPVLKSAKSKRVSVISQSEMLGRVMKDYEGIGIAGVHGKTTTSSLVAYILKSAGYSPSYAIGTNDIPGLGANAAIGEGSFFVVEADEYKRSDLDLKPKFLDLPIKHLIITSIELDHPDIYETAEEVYQAFYKLLVRIPRSGTVVACADWLLVRRLITRLTDRSTLTYGFSNLAAYQIVDVSFGETTSFFIKHQDRKIGPFETALFGEHNLLNATAAIVLLRQLGLSEEAIKKGLKTFVLPQRRFQTLGFWHQAEIITDYAHHPTAVAGLLDAVSARFPDRRVITVFQPHTYSRTARLLKEFGRAFTKTDVLLIVDIFASAREKPSSITARDLINEIKAYRDVEYRSTLEEAARYLESSLKPNDLVLLVGAGDVYKVFDLLASRSDEIPTG